MTELHLETTTNRDLYFQTAAAEKGVKQIIIEKDYWVVWTLDRLFSLEGIKDKITFKGGTSLSKIYGVIQRFSEDIDISIDRSLFGFIDGKDPKNAESNTKKRKLMEDLVKTCTEYIQETLLINLQQSITDKLETRSGWTLTLDPTDSQTILFTYPSTPGSDTNIPQHIKIEFGSRTDHCPIENNNIKSYVKEELPDKVTEPNINIRNLKIERTFWEKATILHQHAHFPEDKPFPNGLSRHYYDLYCLLNFDIERNFTLDSRLLEKVVDHKNFYYRSKWANYDTAKKGTLKLIPEERISKLLEGDYKTMKEMFFGTYPAWADIIEKIALFEEEFNS